MSTGATSFWRGLSMTRGSDYRSKLENYRGKFAPRDVGSAGVITRGREQTSPVSGAAPFTAAGLHPLRKNVDKSFVVEVVPDLDALLTKADGGGERTLTPDELRKQRELSFTRKDMGVSNAPFSGPDGDNQ